MALWEYKIIGSGKGGFGSPSLLESHLNQLGKDEWEIIAFITSPENPLAFQGLARRTTQRDWTLQDAAAAAAKAEAEKLRAEFAAKFQAAQSGAPVEDKPSSLVADTAAPEDGLRRLRDTDRDQDPEALADSDEMDEVALDAEDELPTFFDYIRPYMRRNQRGPGLSLAVDYLANKIDQSPGDIVTALKECGFSIPEDEDDDPAYIEYDGDLYWVNVNRHHQLFINTKEKPRLFFERSRESLLPRRKSPRMLRAKAVGRAAIARGTRRWPTIRVSRHPNLPQVRRIPWQQMLQLRKGRLRPRSAMTTISAGRGIVARQRRRPQPQTPRSCLAGRSFSRNSARTCAAIAGVPEFPAAWVSCRARSISRMRSLPPPWRRLVLSYPSARMTRRRTSMREAGPFG
ncbi:MAG: DUF4177 domain-containing protein [Bryobacterales bacterium]|nr:DUF4177 domain-containing protein [Bryobacterales bacterium]